MGTTQVKCQACGLVLNDSEPTDLENRPPCPRCGSTRRIFEIRVGDRIAASGQIRIAASGSLGSYLTVPVVRLQEIRRILDTHGQRYWTEPHALSVNGQPAVAIINLGPGSDVQAVERLISRER